MTNESDFIFVLEYIVTILVTSTKVTHYMCMYKHSSAYKKLATFDTFVNTHTYI